MSQSDFWSKISSRIGLQLQLLELWRIARNSIAMIGTLRSNFQLKFSTFSINTEPKLTHFTHVRLQENILFKLN